MIRVLGAALLLWATCVEAQTASDAIKSITRLGARIEIGISYRDYTNALGDANADVRAFLDGTEAAKNPEARTALQAAIGRYVEARELWATMFSRYGSQFLPPNSAVAREVLTRYPGAAAPIANVGAALPDGSISVEMLLPHIWRAAALDVAAARRALAAE